MTPVKNDHTEPPALENPDDDPKSNSNLSTRSFRRLIPYLIRRKGIFALTVFFMIIYSAGVNSRNLIPAIFFDGILISEELSDDSVLSNSLRKVSDWLGFSPQPKDLPSGIPHLTARKVDQVRVLASREDLTEEELKRGSGRFTDGRVQLSVYTSDEPSNPTPMSLAFTELKIRFETAQAQYSDTTSEWVFSSARLIDIKYRQQRSDPEKMGLLKFIFIFGISVCILIAVSRFIQAYLIGYLLNHILADLRRDLMAHMCTLSLSFFNQRSKGDLLSRLSNDLTTVSQSLQIFFSDLILKPLMFSLAVVVIFMINWWLALITLSFFPFLFLIVLKFGKKVRRRSRQQSNKRGVMTMALEQLFGGIRTVKSFSMEPHEKEHFENRNMAVVFQALRTLKAKVLSNSTVELASHLGVIIALSLGGYYLIRGELGMSIGDLIAFTAALNTMYTPVKSLARAYSSFQESLGAMERVTEIFETRPTVTEIEDAGTLKPFKNSIEFKNVSFNYGRESVLEGIDLKFPSGQLTAIVGPTGSGKSTLVDLILRFYDPTQGAISIDGTDIKTVTLESLLSQIAIVSQDPFLFDTTIKNNLLYGRPDATQEEIEEAARAANIHDFIVSLPEGYETMIGDRGAMLSGGQRQRMTIARALLKNAPILILDEATSSLDTESEAQVQTALEKLFKVRSTIAIAHRLSTIRDADKIIVLEDGKIVEMGTFDELLEANGLFRRLHDKQFEENSSE